MSQVSLSQPTFDPWEEVRAYREGRGLGRGAAGAVSVFVGTMRDFNEGETVHEMFLEHYPGMTERCLEEIVAQALAATGALDARVVHRVGVVRPGEDIVLVAAYATHRAEAFLACRTIVEALKRDAPFWKRERCDGGTRWVGGNTPESSLS